MIFQDVEKTVLPVLGTVAVNTERIRGIATLFYAKAVTSTTTFDLKITDNKSRIVRYYREETGTLRDIVHLPVDGIYTLTIENASVNEAIDIYIRVEEWRK